MTTAFLLICSLNGVIDKQGIYFRNANSCMDFKQLLSNQSYMKNDDKYLYECICKLVPQIDSNKVRVY
tara:strand:+ start:1258 stop:1461 length:204 start_codon:yes stop_codon:yes gene_type:complete